MKKFLLCMTLAGLLMPAVAQEKNVPVEGWTSAGISNSYDRQTQNAVYPMTKRHDDGFIGSTWTNDDNPDFPDSSIPKRGIGYSYSTDNGATWSVQENRVGGIPIYWPSYAQWGANGEAILGRNADAYTYNGVQIAQGLVLLTRPNKGEGEWTITPVPYPAGTSPAAGYTMVWARMTTSGNNHQYIHIISPMQTPSGQPYNGYDCPVLYYRTQNGGTTWDIAGTLVPQIAGEVWDTHSEYSDAITFADTKGDAVVCSFIKYGYDGYVLKSFDNGDTWECIKFFDSPIGYYISPSQYADTCYIPVQGCVALDNDGKIHVAFAVLMSKNNQSNGQITYFRGYTTSFLSYWNEYMGTIDGDAEYVYRKIDPIFDEFIDWEQSGWELYIKSTVPKLPVIGFYTPSWSGDHYFLSPEDFAWIQTSYNRAGLFSFPQMTFDKNNVLHLAYLGIADGCRIEDRWMRNPFYTSTNGGAVWTQTEYLINNIEFMDLEFAYLTLAGIDDTAAEPWIYLMTQVDNRPGTHTGGDHTPTENKFFHFHLQGNYVEPCYPVTDFAVDYTEDCKAELTWNTPSTGADQYKIYRDNALIATLDGENSYTDTNFDPKKPHTWKVAITCTNEQPYPVGITKPACAPPCNPATNLKVKFADNCNETTLTWTAAVDMPDAKYNVYRDDEQIANNITATQCTDNAAVPDVEHKWAVKTVCIDGEATAIEITGTCETTAIHELANNVAIYPNPTTGKITITAKDFNKVEIYNTIGQLIETKTVNIFDISNYNTGIYFFKIYDNNNNSITKYVMITK